MDKSLYALEIPTLTQTQLNILHQLLLLKVKQLQFKGKRKVKQKKLPNATTARWHVCQ